MNTELKPCPCQPDNDTSELTFRAIPLTTCGRYDLYIVECIRCGDFEPVKVPSYLPRHGENNEFSDYMAKAWNTRK